MRLHFGDFEDHCRKAKTGNKHNKHPQIPDDFFTDGPSRRFKKSGQQAGHNQCADKKSDGAYKAKDQKKVTVLVRGQKINSKRLKIKRYQHKSHAYQGDGMEVMFKVVMKRIGLI